MLDGIGRNGTTTPDLTSRSLAVSRLEGDKVQE
jgi:hypothetical protein